MDYPRLIRRVISEAAPSLTATLSDNNWRRLSAIGCRFQPFVQIVPQLSVPTVIGFETLATNGHLTFAGILDDLANAGVEGSPLLGRLAAFVASVEATSQLRNELAFHGIDTKSVVMTVNVDETMWPDSAFANILHALRHNVETGLTIEVTERVSEAQVSLVRGLIDSYRLTVALDDSDNMDSRVRAMLEDKAALVKRDVKAFRDFAERIGKAQPKALVRELTDRKRLRTPLVIEGIEHASEVAFLQSHWPKAKGNVYGQGFQIELPSQWADVLVKNRDGQPYGYYLKSEVTRIRAVATEVAADRPAVPPPGVAVRPRRVARHAGVPVHYKRLPDGFDESLILNVDSGPFGFADAASADDLSLESRFLSYQGGSGIGMSSSGDVRVIFGRKGSGKTHYLTRLKLAAEQESGRLVLGLFRNPPMTNRVVAFDQFAHAPKEQAWERLWSNALLLSAYSGICFDQRLASYVPERDRQQFQDRCNEAGSSVLKGVRAYLNLYDAADYLLARYASRGSVEIALTHAVWSMLRQSLPPIVRRLPPMYAYYDCADDWFENAPGQWLASQYGLFRAMLGQMESHNPLAGRLHSVVALRDLVWAKFLSSEHRDRYIGDSRIQILSWSHDAVEGFLSAKVAKLPNRASKKTMTVPEWLGMHEIYLRRRRHPESVESYLVRHTRWLPRDIVHLGNALCTYLGRYEHASLEQRTELVRWVVHKLAIRWGHDLLASAAAQTAAFMLSEGSGAPAPGNGLLDSSTFKQGYIDTLSQVLSCELASDVFGADELKRVNDRTSAAWPGHSNTIETLWQVGAIGYVLRKDRLRRSAFLDGSDQGRLQMPTAKQYILRSCLLDALNLRGRGRVVA